MDWGCCCSLSFKSQIRHCLGSPPLLFTPLLLVASGLLFIDEENLDNSCCSCPINKERIFDTNTNRGYICGVLPRDLSASVVVALFTTIEGIPPSVLGIIETRREDHDDVDVLNATGKRRTTMNDENRFGS